MRRSEWLSALRVDVVVILPIVRRDRRDRRIDAIPYLAKIPARKEKIPSMNTTFRNLRDMNAAVACNDIMPTRARVTQSHKDKQRHARGRVLARCPCLSVLVGLSLSISLCICLCIG